MEESLVLHQIKCPNCGTPITSYNEFEPVIKCSSCDSVIQVTGTMTKEVARPERIIPFQSTKENFENFVVNQFIDGAYVPVDIFEKVAFKDVNCIYLPMFLYEGKYEASFSCSIGFKEKQVGVGTNFSGDKVIKEKEVIKYRPHNGTTKNNFSILCLAYEGKDITPELASFTQTFPYEAAHAKEFNPEYLKKKDVLVLPHNLDKETIWFKNGENLIKETAEDHARSQVRAEIIKDFAASVSYDTKHEGRLVYVPFWFVYFEYGQQQFHVLMDGMGKSYSVNLPCDQVRLAATEKWEKMPKWFKWGKWVVAAILIPTAGFTAAIIALASLWIGQFIMKSVAKSKVAGIIKEGRDAREQAYKTMA